MDTQRREDALTISFDFDAKTLFGQCAPTFTYVGKMLYAVELNAAQLTLSRVHGPTWSPLAIAHQGSNSPIHIPMSPPGRSATVSR